MMHDAETKPDVVNMSSVPLTVSGGLDANDVVVKMEPMETGADGVTDHAGSYIGHIAAAPAVIIKPESPVLHEGNTGPRLVIGSRSGSPAHSVYSGSSDATESADEDGNEDAASGDVVDGQSRFRPDADPAGAYSFELPLPTATSSVAAADGSLSGRSATGGSRSECRVCGDEASGMYFGALVCVPCKTFFLRYAGEGKKFTCRYRRSCDVTVSTRTQCKSCRYQKCVRVGMRRRIRPTQVQIGEGQQLCAVCSDVGNGIHFGVITCEGCKKFFRRGLVENGSYRCKNGGRCSINPQTRNLCRYCRFWKCISVGMSRNAIQMGRPTKTAAVQGSENCVNMQQQQQQSIARPRTSSGGKLSSSPTNIDFKYASGNPAATTSTSWTRSTVGLSGGEVAVPAAAAPGGMVSIFPAGLAATATPSPFANLSSPLLLALPNGLFLTASPLGGGGIRPPSTSAGEQFNPLQLPGALLRQPSVHPVTFPLLIGEAGGNPGMIPAMSSSAVRPSASRQSISPDSTVKEDDPRRPERRDGLLLHPVELRKRSSSRNISDASLSPLLPESEDGPLRKFPSMDFRSESGNHGGELNLSGRSRSQELLPVSLAASKVGSGSAVVGYCGGRIDKAYRKMAQSRDPRPQNSTNNAFSDDGESADKPIDCSIVKRRNSGSQSSSPTPTGGLSVVQTAAESSTPTPPPPMPSTANSLSYWVTPPLAPVGNVSSGRTDWAVGQHWDIVNGIIPMYDRFVHQGTFLNRMLKDDFEGWSRRSSVTNLGNELPLWIKNKVIPAYTVASVNYCKSLPGFQDFDPDDQVTVIRLGQSSSRILIAAIHWFDVDDKIFRNFLSWRSSSSPADPRCDMFKKMLIEYAEKISALEPDSIEAALLNVLLIFASDYPNLKNVRIIEQMRSKIFATLQAYTSAKYGTPSNRAMQLCSYGPEARRLGLLHYHMTKTKTMTAEEVSCLPSISSLPSHHSPTVCLAT